MMDASMCVHTQVLQYMFIDMHSHMQILPASVEPNMCMALKLVQEHIFF